MAGLTLETILIEMIPALIVTTVYSIFFRKRRNKFIEAFIIMLYLKTVTFFLYYIVFVPVDVPFYFDPEVTSDTLAWTLVMDFLFKFAASLQEYFIWVMISFFAVLFGLVILLLKLALQDPLKMAFSNVIRSVVGREPVSDGYSGFRHRLHEIEFVGVEAQPLDPEVVNKAWRESWKDYLIIGLVTLLPSLAVYAVVENIYAAGIIVFLTWIYRFGYPAGSRIAKGAGVTLPPLEPVGLEIESGEYQESDVQTGGQDLGSEMMRGVLGWFFRLNLLISVVTLFFQVLGAWNTGTMDALYNYYFWGVTGALPPIAFAILILPLTEDFAVTLYKELIESISKARTKMSAVNWRGALTNVGAAFVTGCIALGALLGAVWGTTLSYSNQFFTQLGGFEIYPGEVTGFVEERLLNAGNNSILLPHTTWALLMLVIPFAIMLMLGIMGHFVRSRIKGSIETFAVVSGMTVSLGAWFIIPGLDYIFDTNVTPVTFGDSLFYRLRPIIEVAGPEDFIYQIAAQLIVNLPLYIFTALFVMYFFRFRDKWKVATGDELAPLLSVHQRDIVDAVAMFAAGLIASVIGIWFLSLLTDPSIFRNLIEGLMSEIADPDGLEAVLQSSTGIFVIIAEHNIVRTLMMLLIGPIFWSAVLWFFAVQKEKSELNVARIGLILMAIGSVIAIVWTSMDLSTGLRFFTTGAPWSDGAELGFRALLTLGIIFGAYVLYILFNSIRGRSSGVVWFPAIITIIAIEYFVYDDQFTLIALIILPMIMAALYKIFLSGRPEVREEDTLLMYIRFSIMAVAVAEVLSTALLLGGIGVIFATDPALNLPWFLASILPHAVIEIPAFLFAAAASIRIARNLAPTITAEDWTSIPAKTKELLTDERTWRAYVLIIFFLVLAALIEANITQAFMDYVWLLTH
ncbi:MAG: stage II sporulation protein M [Candidatus Thorarchaeota archaeon]